MAVPSADFTVSLCVPSSQACETSGQRRTHRTSPSPGRSAPKSAGRRRQPREAGRPVPTREDAVVLASRNGTICVRSSADVNPAADCADPAGGETGSPATGNPGTPCYEHRAIFVAAAGSDGRPHSNDGPRPPNSSHSNTTGYQLTAPPQIAS